jgi:hypothetical protein
MPNWFEDPNENLTWDPPSERYDVTCVRTETAPVDVSDDLEWENYYYHRDQSAAGYYGKDWAFPGKNSRLPW